MFHKFVVANDISFVLWWLNEDWYYRNDKKFETLDHDDEYVLAKEIISFQQNYEEICMSSTNEMYGYRRSSIISNVVFEATKFKIQNRF